jgi:hypothetical protein
MFVSMLLICVQFSSPEYKAEAASCRYGRVIVEGNRYTPNSVIMALIKLHPGRILLASDIHSARRRLRASLLFRQDRAPTVRLEPDGLDTTFVDVRVMVQDRPVNAYLFHSHEFALKLATGLHDPARRAIADEIEEVLEQFLAYVEWRMEQRAR